MKKLGFLLFILICLTACGGGTGSDSNDEGQYRELSMDTESRGAIETVGDVDWYHFRAVETNNVLQLRCHGETSVPEVEFLVTVFEKDANGDLVRLWADHAPEDAALPANLVLNIPIPEPKDLYISVRDLMDDEAAPDTRYRLQLAYTNPTTDNATFGLATDLGSVGAGGICQTDAIETVADVDCFSFSIPEAGVYSIAAAFNDPGISTPVRLEMKLYEADGTSIYPAAGKTVLNTSYRLYLEAGEHFVALQDRGKNDADAFAQYTVCINQVSVTEVLQNDTQETAVAVTADEQTLAYQQDEDWYHVSVEAPSGTEFQTIKLTFSDTVPAGNNFPFQIRLKKADAVGADIVDHEYPAGAADYTVQVRVKADEGEPPLVYPVDYLIAVRPMPGATVTEGLNYTLSAEVIGVEDGDEIPPNDNSSINSAEELVIPATPPYTVTVDDGKISYRGDDDWYRVEVPNGTDDQILAINFQAASTSNVEYCVEIMRGSDLRTLSDANHQADVPTQLKTSFYAAAGTESTYNIKVCDCQGDDGDDVAYSLSVTSSPVPTGVPDEGRSPVYNSETYERGLISGDFDTGQAVDVTCAIYPQYAPVFKANNQMLKISSMQQSGSQYVSDWIAGYVDYQGDQDWYVLDIVPMDSAETWYYDIEISVFTPGSDVEYTWKLYRDVAREGLTNQVVVDRMPGIDMTLDGDGVVAAWATDLVTDPMEAVAQTVPDDTAPVDSLLREKIWVSNSWQNDRFYLAISDFNYTRLSGGAFNTVPDDDWGYNAPYYFQVRLTCHPDESSPPSN